MTEQEIDALVAQNEKLVGVLKEARDHIRDLRIAVLSTDRRADALRLAVWYGAQFDTPLNPDAVQVWADKFLSFLGADDV